MSITTKSTTAIVDFSKNNNTPNSTQELGKCQACGAELNYLYIPSDLWSPSEEYYKCSNEDCELTYEGYEVEGGWN